jgi:hypothetical protein
MSHGRTQQVTIGEADQLANLAYLRAATPGAIHVPLLVRVCEGGCYLAVAADILTGEVEFDVDDPIVPTRPFDEWREGRVSDVNRDLVLLASKLPDELREPWNLNQIRLLVLEADGTNGSPELHGIGGTSEIVDVLLAMARVQCTLQPEDERPLHPAIFSHGSASVAAGVAKSGRITDFVTDLAPLGVLGYLHDDPVFEGSDVPPLDLERFAQSRRRLTLYQ